jgi:predicted Zn-dependent peptidase
MRLTKKIFGNGLRLVSAVRRHSDLAAVTLFIRAGSRYDSLLDLPAGTAHLLEHLLFKSCKKISSEQIFYEIESRGGKIDGGTTKEYSTIQVTIPSRHLARALRLICDIVFHPSFNAGQLRDEKEIVFAEIRREKDQHSVIWDLFHKTLWTEHPFQNPILGNEQTIEQIRLGDAERFYKACYTAPNMVLSVVSKYPSADIERMVGAMYRPSKNPPKPPFAKGEKSCDELGGLLEEKRQIKRAHLHKHIHQAHILIGFRTCSMTALEKHPLRLIEIALGGSGFSRLFKDLRENHHWAYSFDVISAHYEDAGYFAVYCAVEPRHAKSVEREIFAHLAKVGEKGLTAQELKCAKEQYKGNLLRRFEANLSVARITGIETLLTGGFEPFEQAIAHIESVRNSGIMKAAKLFLRQERAVVVTAGDLNT